MSSGRAGLPHAVDVPVTDMDDPEDDVIFNTKHLAQSTLPPDYDRNQNLNQHDVLRNLDYETSDSTPQNTSVFDKVKSLFVSSANTANNTYEMLLRSDSAETPDQDWLDDHDFIEPPIDLRDRRLKLLEKKVKNRTIVGGITLIMVVLVFLVLYLTKQQNLPINSQLSSGVVKTVYSNSTHNFYKTTIVVSLDGFHPHYISKEDTPNLHEMLINDYGAPYMEPSFPSLTFPNHWTLVTGLFPSEHGIVGNTFWDPKLKKEFVNTDPKRGGLDPDFWRGGGEPIWQTAKLQGVKSAVHMWPGSEVPHVGPEFDFDKFNGSEVLSAKVDRVMQWLDRDIKSRPELILTYVPTVDTYGHQFGISGPNLTESLTYVDSFVALMNAEIKKRNLENIINLIVVSDHGMAPTSKDRVLYLDDLVDLDEIEHIDGWPLFGLRPKGDLNETYNIIKANFEKLDAKLTQNYHLYKVEEFPKRFQFGGQLRDHRFNYRLAPIWLVPDVGYSITTHQQMKDNGFEYKPKGVHGYDNSHLLMRAIFLGKGPYFEEKLSKSKKIQPFANTEVYNIICDTLDLSPAPNNGSIPTKAIFSNILPETWSDDLAFPNLPFEVDHIVRNNATYDFLWRLGRIANPEDNDKGNEDSPPSPTPSLVTISYGSSALDVPTSLRTVTTENETNKVTSTAHAGLGDIFEDILDGIEDGLDAIGDKIHGFIDDTFGEE